MATPQTFVQRAVRFGRTLRRNGVNSTPGQVMDFVRAVELIDVGSRNEFRETARACFVTHKDEMPVFDRVFDAFWRSKADFLDENAHNSMTGPDEDAVLADDSEEGEGQADGESGIDQDGLSGQRLEVTDGNES